VTAATASRGAALAQFAQRHIAPSATMVSGGLGCFRAATSVGAQHKRIVTGGGKASMQLRQFKAVNTLLGNLKTAVTAPTTPSTSPSTRTAIAPSSSSASIAAST